MFKRMLLPAAVIAAMLLAGAAVMADPAPTRSQELGKLENTPLEVNDAPGNAKNAADGHAEEKKELLPNPFASKTWFSALWVVVIFAVLLAILYPTAWKSVLAGLKAREEKIRKDIADAEAARTRAESTLREYTAKLADAERHGREVIAKAAADAEAIAQSIRARAQQESEETKEKALKEIDAAKSAALREVYEQTAVLATNVAEKILRRNLNAADQKDLVAQSLEQLQGVGRN